MANWLSGIFVTILVVFVFGIYPAYRSAGELDDNTKAIAHNALVIFVDTVRSQGYIDPQTYQQFRSNLDSSGGVYDVKLEYYKKVFQPTYTDPNDISTFQNTFTVRYDGYFTKQIMDTMYPINNSAAINDPARRFGMHTEDLFNVRIQTKGQTMYQRLGNTLFHNQSSVLVDKYGGMVRSEAP